MIGGDTTARIAEVRAEAMIGLSLDDQLPRWVMSRIGDHVCRWAIPERQQVSKARWAMVVREALHHRSTLGIIEIRSGGLPALAERFEGWPFHTLVQNVDRWTKTRPPLVIRRYEEGRRKDPRVASLEIPLLTDVLVWLARQQAESLMPMKGALTSRQARFLAYDAVERQASRPPIAYPSDGWTRGQPGPRMQASRAIDAIKTWRNDKGRHPFE